MKTIAKIVKVIIAISAVTGLIAGILDLFENRKEKTRKKGIYEKYIKRPLDAFLSTGALIVFSPILLVTAILVRIKLGAPVLFTQDRPGKGGKIFKLYKFRSMTDEKDKEGNLLPDDKRLTEFGKKLRSTSLDEMPELINMIKGEIDIIGTTKKNLDFMRFSAA